MGSSRRRSPSRTSSRSPGRRAEVSPADAHRPCGRSAAPADVFTLSGGFAYTDAAIENFRRQDGTFDPRRTGERLPLAPEWKWTLAADYRWAPQALPANLRFNVQYASTDEQQSDFGARPELNVDSFGLIDAFVAISDKSDRYELRLIGRNLTDERFTTLITPGGPGGALRFAIPREADRYFGVSIRSRVGG